MSVRELLRVSLTVADLSQAQKFYREALGFAQSAERTIKDTAWVRLLGIADATVAQIVEMQVGTQVIEAVAFDPPGRPYPPDGRGNDPWFQHIALVTDDIAAGYAKLKAHGATAISTHGPQLLPPNTGSVSAYKFRDPEGHPLELLFCPPGVGDDRWHGTPMPGIRGYDHSAIVVTDLERSLEFYTELLGLSVGRRSLNQGIEQDRLDGVSGCLVDVVGLKPADAPTPHVEMLFYRQPSSRPPIGAIMANDVGSTRVVFRVDDLGDLAEHLERAGVSFVSPGVVTLGEGAAATIRDPDGHMIVLTD